VRRLLRLSASLAALAIGISIAAVGCTYVNPPALAIAESSSKDPYFTLSATELRTQVDEKLKSATRTNDPTSMSTSNVADFLTTQVVLRIQKHELERLGIAITDADKTQAEQALSASTQQQGGPEPTPEDIEFQAGSLLLRSHLLETSIEKLGTTKRDARAREIYDDAVENGYSIPGELCLHVIQIPADPTATDPSSQPTEAQIAAALAEATEAKRRLDAGEPFEAVADDVSVLAAQIPGGDLQCRAYDGSEGSYPAELVQLVADVPSGTVSEPKFLEGSYVLLRVDNRTAARTPTFDEVRDKAEEAADGELGNQLLTALRDELFKNSFVTIDPKYGRWDPALQRVSPPDGAATPTTPTTTTTLPTFDPSARGGVPTQPQSPAAETPPSSVAASTSSSSSSTSTSSVAGADASTTVPGAPPGGVTTTSTSAASTTTSSSPIATSSTAAVGR